MITEHLQLVQLDKVTTKKDIPDIPTTKLGKKENEKRIFFKDVFRQLTGAMFSQISHDGKFAQVNLRK